MKPISALTVLVLAAALAACQSAPREVAVMEPRTMPPVGVEGAWVDPNGIVSTFSGGSFSTRTTDTNQLLASGTYVNLTPRLVEINMTSMVRKTQQKVNCAVASPAQLNCTTDTGAQFVLNRRA